MNTEIRYVDKRGAHDTPSYPMHPGAVHDPKDPEFKAWNFGAYVIDRAGIQWLLTEHSTYASAVDAQAEFWTNYAELVARLTDAITGTHTQNMGRAMRYHQTVGDHTERIQRILSVAEAFTWKHFGFVWGVDDFIRYGERQELPPFGADFNKAVMRCGEAFELSGFKVPTLLLD